MYNLKDKSVLIIGGSQGMGFEIARMSLELGAKVSIASRSLEKLTRAQTELNGQVSVQALDASKEKEVKTLFEKMDTIDHLVLTASGGAGGPLQELDMNAARALFDSKLWLQVYATKYAVPKMSKNSSIIMFSGIVSRKSMPGQMPYTGVAGAIESLGRMLALELAPIRVNVITPGFVKTPAWNQFMPEEAQEAFFDDVAQTLPLKRVGEATDVAKGALFFMDNPFVTGTVLDIDGGHKVI